MKKAILFTVAASLASSYSLANESNNELKEILLNENIYIYDVAHGGNGCPDGSVDALLSPDHSTISVFFDQYYADSTESRRGRDRKSCNIGVSVKVPHGLSVALIELDYRGYVDLGAGAYGELSADYFFAGEPTGAELEKQWIDPDAALEEDFYIEDDYHAGSIVWGACGEDAILRTNTSLKAYEGPNEEPAYIQLDTIDTTASVLYQLQWKSCEE